MGMFQVRVTTSHPGDPARAFQDPFWVDTGTLYSSEPEARLHAIGIQPRFTRDFVFADGKKGRHPVGEASFTIESTNETISCLIAFDPPGSLFLPGATSLKNFGAPAVPTARKLRPITAAIGTTLAGRTHDVISA